MINTLALLDSIYMVGAIIVQFADTTVPPGQIADPGINTTFPGSALVTTLLGNLKYLGLAGSLAALFIGGAVWGLATVNGNGSTWGRRFLLGGVVGSIITGLGTTIVNTFSSVS